MMWTIGLVALLAAMAGCGSAETRKAKYTALAQQYIDEENWPKARVALRNLLKIDPRSAEGYFLYGRVEEKEKNWTSAFRNYLRVVELDPDHYGALTRLAKFYLEGNEPDRAQETAERILATHPGDATAEAIEAGVLAKKGQVAEAIARVEAINQHHPDNPDAAMMLASLYAGQQRLPNSEEVLERALKAEPRNVALLINLGNALMQSGKSDDAEQAFRRVVEIEPKVFEHRARLAVLYERGKKPEQAEAVLREAIRQEPDNEQRWLALAELAAVRPDVQKEEAVLQEARKALPDSMKIRFALGRFYEVTNREEQARRLYEEVIDEHKTLPPGLEARVRLASLELGEGNQEAAQQRVDDVLKENPQSSDALILKGKMSLARREGKEAVQAFRLALKDQPQNAEVHLLLGQAYLLTGEEALARESVEKALALNPRLADAHRVMARLEMAGGRRAEARAHLERILQDAPKDLDALTLLMDLELADQNWRGAEQTLARLREAGAAPYVLGIAEGGLFRGRKQWEKAIAAYEKASAAQPQSLDPLNSIVAIELQRGRVEQARQRLQRLLSTRPDHPYAHGLLGDVLVAQKDPKGAEQEYREAARIKPDWTMPWLKLASLQLVQQRSGESMATLEAGLKANPQASDLRMMLAATLTSAGRSDEAMAHYEMILKQTPSAVWAANNLAMLLVDKGDPESLKRAASLTQPFEKAAHPVLVDTLAWVYVKTGRGADAVRLLKPVVKQSPDQPVFNYHLGMAYYSLGDTRAATAYLAKAVDSGKTFQGLSEARTVLAQLRPQS